MKSLRQWTLLMLIALSLPLLSPAATAQERTHDVVGEMQFSEAELAQMLAPIALYPDSLLTHILIASTYPLEVVQANRWRNKHPDLSAEQAVKRAEKKGWDPSVLALVAFPDVLKRLNDDLDWTQRLGDAFLQDEAEVLDSIQRLRQQAERADTFDDMDNMRVTKVNRKIIIEPVQQALIYVPYYDTRVVYGHWHWYNYPPVYWVYPPRYGVRYPSRISGHFYWNTGIHISFNYYFSAFQWQKRHIVVTHHRHSHRYRPYRRIVTSSGAQRWHHKPAHRHGVAYRSAKVKARYNNYRPNKYDVKQRNVKRHELSKQPKHYSTAQIKKHREQSFNYKLKQSRQHDASQADRRERPSKYYEKRDRLQLQDEHKRNPNQAVKRQQERLRDKSHLRERSHQPVKSHQRERPHQPVKSHQRERSHQQENRHQRNQTQQKVRAQAHASPRNQARVKQRED